MTLYDLTRAMARHKKFLIGGLVILLILVVVMMFDFGGGEVQIRGNAKYESQVQIAVISPATESLTDADTADGLMQAAAVYADMLSSSEAAVAVGDLTGYKMDEPMNALASSDAPLILNTVIGPSFDLATQAALNSFEWLGTKLQEPLVIIGTPTTTTIPPDIVLSAPFETKLTVDVDERLASVADDLFVRVTADSGEQVTFPVAQTAGSDLSTRATFAPVTTLTLTLETSAGELVDVLRVAPVPPPTIVDAYPTLDLLLASGAIERDTAEDSLGWRFSEDQITVAWVDGVPPSVPTQEQIPQVKIALVTSNPQAVQIGGRRGPLLGIAVLFVGLIVLITAVIVADTWNRERRAAGSSSATPDRDDDATAPTPPARRSRRSSSAKTPDAAADAVDAASIET
jgi:hypothetical protein